MSEETRLLAVAFGPKRCIVLRKRICDGTFITGERPANSAEGSWDHGHYFHDWEYDDHEKEALKDFTLRAERIWA